MIPVIGTAVVNSTYWVKRLINSIDFPVENLFIVNNNGRDEITEELNKLTHLTHPFIQKIKITHLPSNIGVSGAWNLTIKCYMNSPYWVIVNDDVSFGEGFLEEMYETSNNNPNVGIIHGHEGEFNVGSWDLFLIKDFIIQNYGLFDENLYPAYNEDADYIMRFIHHPTHKVMNLNSNYFHGKGNKGEYNDHGSQTRKTDPSLDEKLNYVNYVNMEYMNQKWGEGWRMCCPTPLPFQNQPISTTTYDLEFVRKKYLGF